MATLALSATVAAQGAAAGVPHPAHIHSGTCAELGDVVAPLQDVVLVVPGAAPSSPGAERVGASVTRVDPKLEDILGSPHAIMAHESAENIGNYIACADLVGQPSEDGDLVVALGEQNGSGYVGVAFLHEDSGRTSVYLSLTGPGGGMGPSPSDAAAPAAGSVTIQDFSFQPASLQVSVGATVTWTNQDSAGHTATAEDGSFDSGTLKQGDTFSHTFDTAGTFAYICKIHPNMTATITVG
jgi:plastocyanin